MIEKQMPFLDKLLEPFRPDLGKDYTAYANHVYRMVHFCLALHPCSAEEREKVLIAGAFHDLGIWTHQTLDYLPPSIRLAEQYLAQRDRGHWSAEIRLMIDQHHKMTKCEDPFHPLVEVFRRADMVDVSLGAVKWGLPKTYIQEVKTAFPNAGFHMRLNQLFAGWILRHPLRPAPMMKW